MLKNKVCQLTLLAFPHCHAGISSLYATKSAVYRGRWFAIFIAFVAHRIAVALYV